MTVSNTVDSSASSGTVECQVCYEQVPYEIVDASAVLYSPDGNRLRGLTEAIANFLRIDAPSAAVGNGLTDQSIAELAIESLLGISHLGALVAAYRHYGEYGEQCRDEKHVEVTPHSFESEGQD